MPISPGFRSDLWLKELAKEAGHHNVLAVLAVLFAWKKVNALYFNVNVLSTNVLTVACVANSLNP